MPKYDYFSINFAPCVGLAFLFAFLFANKDLDKNIKKVFYALIGAEFIEMVIYSLELWTATFSVLSPWRILFSAIGYSTRALLLYLILLLPLRASWYKKVRRLLAIPMVITYILSYSAFFTKIVYYYNPDNVFKRGPLGYAPHFILIFYLLVIITVAVKEHSVRERFETFIVIAIALLTFSSMMIETIYSIRSIGRTSIVLSTVFYYMYFQTQTYRRTLDREHRLREGLEHESKTDGLTELLNKKAFTEETQAALLTPSEIAGTAFVFVDLDEFKNVNDTLGHIMGDAVIRDAALKIKSLLGENNIIGRFGGDEFCILMKNVTREEIDKLMEMCVQKLNAPYYKESRTINLTVSIGVAYAEKNMSADYQNMLEVADSAVYEAKRLGRNRFVVKECVIKQNAN